MNAPNSSLPVATGGCQVCGGRTGGNGHKLKQEVETGGLEKKFLLVQPLSLEVSSPCLDKSLSNPVSDPHLPSGNPMQLWGSASCESELVPMTPSKVQCLDVEIWGLLLHLVPWVEVGRRDGRCWHLCAKINSSESGFVTGTRVLPKYLWAPSAGSAKFISTNCWWKWDPAVRVGACWRVQTAESRNILNFHMTPTKAPSLEHQNHSSWKT